MFPSACRSVLAAGSRGPHQLPVTPGPNGPESQREASSKHSLCACCMPRHRGPKAWENSGCREGSQTVPHMHTCHCQALGPAGFAAAARGAGVCVHVDYVEGQRHRTHHDWLIGVRMREKLTPILFPREADDSPFHINFY